MVGPLAYQKKFGCKFCGVETTVNVPQGCFLDIDYEDDGRKKIVRIELMEERQKIPDVPIGQPTCERCKCVSGWMQT